MPRHRRNYLQVHSYLLPDERERSRRVAEQRGMSVAALMRLALLRELDGPDAELTDEPRSRRPRTLTTA